MIIVNYLTGKKDYQIKIFLFLSMLLVLALSLWGIEQNYTIGIWGDEFGYWQSAAYLLGKDWSNVASTNGYYGFGMGFILAPIMYFFHDNTVFMYQAALVVEAVLLATCVPAAYMCLTNLKLCKSNVFKVLISLVTVVYPSNLIFVRTTMAEVLLIFLFWWSFLLAIKYIRSGKIILAVGLILLSVYAYTVHQRALVMIISSIFIIFIKSGKKIISKKNLFFLLLFAISMAAVILYKDMYIKSFYSQSSPDILKMNDYTGITDKVISAFSSLQGFKNLILSILGKLYYLFVSSYLFIYCGIYFCVKEIFTDIRRKRIASSLPSCYLMLMALGALAVGALAMSSGFDNRTDILIYARYTEYAVGPLILVGLAYFADNFKGMKIPFIFGIILTIVLAIIVSGIIPVGIQNSNMWINCGGISDFIYEKSYSEDIVIILAAKRCILISCFILFGMNICKAKKHALFFCLSLASVACIWTYTAVYTWNTGGLRWKTDLFIQQKEVVKSIAADEVGIYECFMGGFYQFLLPDTEVMNITSLDSLEMLDVPLNIITDTQDENIDYIRQNYKVLKENKRYILWQVQ